MYFSLMTEPGYKFDSLEKFGFTGAWDFFSGRFTGKISENNTIDMKWNHANFSVTGTYLNI